MISSAAFARWHIVEKYSRKLSNKLSDPSIRRAAGFEHWFWSKHYLSRAEAVVMSKFPASIDQNHSNLNTWTRLAIALDSERHDVEDKSHQEFSRLWMSHKRECHSRQDDRWLRRTRWYECAIGFAGVWCRYIASLR
jgi:hypothetical protein